MQQDRCHKNVTLKVSEGVGVGDTASHSVRCGVSVAAVLVRRLTAKRSNTMLTAVTYTQSNNNRTLTAVIYTQ
jgi:hypothetical protein